jgi:hypothetical protein
VTRDVAIEGLDPRARGRLDRLAFEFDRLNAREYMFFAGTPPDPDRMTKAQLEALRLIGAGPRRNAVRSAVSAFVDAAGAAYARRLPLPQTFLLYDALPDRPADRVGLLTSLERAVVAVILWDELGPDDRDVLVGPWDRLVEASL